MPWPGCAKLHKIAVVQACPQRTPINHQYLWYSEILTILLSYVRTLLSSALQLNLYLLQKWLLRRSHEAECLQSTIFLVEVEGDRGDTLWNKEATLAKSPCKHAGDSSGTQTNGILSQKSPYLWKYFSMLYLICLGWLILNKHGVYEFVVHVSLENVT